MEEQLSTAAVADALSRAPVAALLIDAGGVVQAANDAAAELVDLHHSTEIVGTEIFLFTPEELARHRLRDVADGTVEAVLARVEVTTSTGADRTLTAWWRRLVTDEGVRTLCVLSPLELTTSGMPSSPAPGWLALLTTDHEWQIVDISTETQRLLHGDDLVGHGLLGFVHPLDLNECIAALAMLGESTRTVTVGVRLRAPTGWEHLQATFAHLCPHQPPRLLCLLARPATASDPQQRVDALLDEGGAGQLLAHIGRALQRAAVNHDLTAQEAEIISRSVHGAAPRRIAQEMYLAEGTVRNLLSGLYRKFGVHTQLELVSAVLRAG